MKIDKKKYLKFGLFLCFFLLLPFGFVYLKTRYDFYAYSPYDVIISDITPNSAIISWKTDHSVPSYVLLNEKLIGSGEYKEFHRIKIENLEPDSFYSFNISNGKRLWSHPVKKGKQSLSAFALDEFFFITKDEIHHIYLPDEEYLEVNPGELVYVALYDQESGKYSDVKSQYANRYGGVVFDKASFQGVNPLTSVLHNVMYLDNYPIQSKMPTFTSSAYASSGVNCNQKIPNQKSNAVSKEAFVEIANNWSGNRGKNYAQECYNDVVYRAKRAGIDPAFALTIWLKESGASNYTIKPKYADTVEDFGIHGKKNVPPRDFDTQINYFLSLKHKAQCPGLTPWESWANVYRTGSCNTNNPNGRQIGLSYLNDVQRLYRWLTNGKNLPGSVSGFKTIDPIYEELEPKCCAVKLIGKEKFIGVFNEHTNGKSCEELWIPSTKGLNGIVQYPIRLESKESKVSCEHEYKGVCCNLRNRIMWYPQEICELPITQIQSEKSCNNYEGPKACYLRDGKFAWLPILIGDDYELGINNETSCNERNMIKDYTIKLYRGINFIGFDFSPLYHNREILSSELLEIYPQILLIANFKEYEWQDIVIKTSTIPYAGNDFTFEQNRGYLFTVSEDITITLDGWKNSVVYYDDFDKGWQLVGGTLYTQSGWASKLISDLKLNNIDIETVAIWSNEVGFFNYRREEGEEIYGEDVPLEDTKGVFIRAY